MLLTFGFGYWAFVAGMLRFTSYLASWVWWMPITRVFAFPYVFAGVLVVVLLFRWTSRRMGRMSIPLGWAAVGGLVIVSQLIWLPIAQVFGPTETEWHATLAASRQLGAWYNRPPYQGHSIAVPPDRPDVTYGLARFGGVAGKHLVSEMYDPFAYLLFFFQAEDGIRALIVPGVQTCALPISFLPGHLSAVRATARRGRSGGGEGKK